ncbi:hypothetical protein SODG_001599 [Sodalis praecaptivus]|uniref:transcriptional regulator GutM n=1 Tax=Sodalis praecaptivus TaxID=1239307 RepID=UPI0027F03EB5|nr:transcriptional regulator GutM [Sodalis praecaptivus]CAJ0994327.1 hypothetical protein NVIRENTERO_01363 [Sodalis praecaptivus]
MSPSSVLIMFALLAWSGQILLGWRQVRGFNQALMQLQRLGCVAVGRSSGRFRSRVVMALAFDGQGNVRGGFVLRGMTVFARQQPLTQLIGLQREQLNPIVIYPKEPACQTALALAIEPKS